MVIRLDLQEERHASQHPPGRLLLGLEVEGPHVGRAALFRLVDGTLVDVPRVHAVYGDRLDEDHRHRGRQFLQASLVDHTGLQIPARALHEQPVHIGSLSRRTSHVLLVLLSDVTLQRHLVERPLVLARHLLHDGGEEGLRVEEARQPHGVGKLEVGHPALELLDALQQVGVPLGEAVQRRVGPLHPRLRNRVQEHRVTQILHLRRDRQLSLGNKNR